VILANPQAAVSLLFKGGPSLINLMIDVTELRIAVTGPKMLFDRLELVTTLSAFEGYTVAHLSELANALEGTVHCGLVGILPLKIEVKTHRAGGTLEIDLGPPTMYQSEVIVRTRTGETFRELLTRVIGPPAGVSAYAGLHAVVAQTHLEHSHDAPVHDRDAPVHDHARDGAAHHHDAPTHDHAATHSHPRDHDGHA